MATHPIDLFNDDLYEVLKKWGLDGAAKGSGLRAALDDLEGEVSSILDARGPAFSCDHCGSLVTRLYAVREPKGGLLSLCRTCIATGGRVVAAGG